MTTKIKLEAARLPKAFSDLVHSNQFLKLFSFFSVGVSVLSLILNLVMMTRPPLVITLAADARVIEQRDIPKPEDEIKMAVKKYIEYRYKWEPTTVVDRLKIAEIFISPQSLTAFKASTAGVAKFSTDRLVAQRVYADDDKIKVNLEKKIVSILGDRVTAIQGLKAAGDLKLELSFESGGRTKLNPWGVYIVKEREE